MLFAAALRRRCATHRVPAAAAPRYGKRVRCVRASAMQHKRTVQALANKHDAEMQRMKGGH
jgi:hypothetical protein